MGAQCAESDSDGMIVGGYNADIPANNINTCYEYNGTSWAAGGSLNVGYSENDAAGGASDAIAAIGKSGVDSTEDNTEEYNGTSWASGGNLNIGRHTGGVSGNTTDAVSMNGNDGTYDDTVEEYNGTSWSDVANYPVACMMSAVSGSGSTDVITHSGREASEQYANDTYEYNGTSFSSEVTLNTSRRFAGMFGTTSDAKIQGGYNSGGASIAGQEQYNGTSWAAGSDMSTEYGQAYGSKGSGGTAGLMAGGYETQTPGYMDSSEEWAEAAAITLVPPQLIWW